MNQRLLGRGQPRRHIPIEVKNSACTQPRTPNQATSNMDTRSFMVAEGSVCKVFSNSHWVNSGGGDTYPRTLVYTLSNMPKP